MQYAGGALKNAAHVFEAMSTPFSYDRPVGMRGSVSVVMATYNGDRYLRDQLASVREQDRLPAELLIGDDGSTDATHEILQEFRSTAPFPVSIERNAQRLGVGETSSDRRKSNHNLPRLRRPGRCVVPDQAAPLS